MRPAVTFLILLLASIARASAQQQDPKLIDRLLKPDTTRSSTLANKEFNSRSAIDMKPAHVSGASFDVSRTSPMVKEYAFSRSFLGIKNPWFGSKVFSAGDFVQSGKTFDTTKEVPIRRAQVADYYDSTKQANFGSPVVPVRSYTPQPKAGGTMSEVSAKISKDMTIDEVREILNKQH